MLVAARADRQGARLRPDGRPFDQDVVGEVEKLEHAGVALAQAVGSNEGLCVSVWGADDEEGTTLGNDAAV